MLRSAINSDDFSPGSASGRASIALRRPAKAKPVSYWLKLAAEVCSRCSPQLCWIACGNDNTNASYSGRTAHHPGPRRCAPRAGIRRSCPHTRVVLSTYSVTDVRNYPRLRRSPRTELGCKPLIAQALGPRRGDKPQCSLNPSHKDTYSNGIVNSPMELQILETDITHDREDFFAFCFFVREARGHVRLQCKKRVRTMSGKRSSVIS